MNLLVNYQRNRNSVPFGAFHIVQNAYFRQIFLELEFGKSLIVYEPLRGFAKDFITMNSFWKFYVMGSPEIDLFGIAHVKVEFIPVLKIYTIPILGRFV